MKRGFAAQFGERLKFLSPQQATGYFGIFTTAHRAVVPHFRFKKDLILYLNSSRAAPRVGISVSLQQAAGNSNLRYLRKNRHLIFALNYRYHSFSQILNTLEK
jgi:hypothetical protein